MNKWVWSIYVILFPLLFSASESATRAMWVWNYKDATVEDRRIQLLEFCQKRNIQTIFLQIAYDFQTTRQNGDIKCNLHNINELYRFLAKAHDQGIKIQAMDGASKFALNEWHPAVLSQVMALLDFNKKGKENERFDGIHYDIEPYTLSDFWPNKESISVQLLELITKISDKIDKSGQKLILGLAIPFWYEQPGDDGMINVQITWKGKLQPLSYHILDMVDEIAIMAYRTEAGGVNGVLHHSRDEIKYADSVGKKVWVGLETSKVTGDPSTISFYGHPESDLENVIADIHQAFKSNNCFRGIAIHHYGSYEKMLTNTP